MARLTIRYDDGSYGVARDLPCGENSHEFKRLLLNALGPYEDIKEKEVETIQESTTEGEI